jgi:hypothetical protein
MTKAELISVMADEAGITKVAAADALDAYVAAVTKELKKSGTGWIWYVLRRQEKSKRGQKSSNRQGN